MPSYEEWKNRSASINPRNQALIHGEFVDAVSGATFDTINPANGRLLTKVACCNSEDVDRAVRSSRQTFEEGGWKYRSPKDRKRSLLKFAKRLSENAEELALLETLDVGKPIADSLNVDIPLSVECISWFAEAIDKLYDEVAPTDRNSFATITREPMGVVAAVIPWNFPLLMACWKAGPALASGNSVILKPAEQSPLTAIRMGEIALEAGLPPGTLNVVPGLGEMAGQAIGLHPDVDCVGFTGSGEIGKRFLQYSGQSNMKRIWLECGGKTPQIVAADCPDLDKVAEAIAWGIWYNQGEVCNAGSRLLVDRSIKEELLDKVMAWVPKISPGDPLDPETKMGAIVSSEQLTRILNYIELGKKEGAKLLIGGKRVREETQGYYFPPTIFDEVRNDMRIAQEEIFGPVLCVITFESFEDAILLANQTPFGLAASVWTKDISKAHRTARALRAGTVYINSFDQATIAVPFGGYKQSGFGRDKSLHAVDKFCELKTTWLDLRS